MTTIFSWFGFFASVSAAALLTVSALAYAKRIGGPGPWMLAAVGAIDASFLCVFRMLRFAAHTMSALAWSSTFSVLLLADAVMMVVAGGLALLGLALMMPKTRSANTSDARL